MATYYMRADGTATKANAIGPESDYTKCMSASTHTYSSTFSPGDNIIVSGLGGDFREKITPPSAGSAGLPITYLASNGATINNSTLVTGWTVYSGNVWQAALTSSPPHVYINATLGDRKTAVVDLVNEYDWYWEANVLYLYAPADPDTQYTSPGTEAGKSVDGFYIQHPHIVVDGLVIKHAGAGIFAISNAAGGLDGVSIRNCTCEWNFYWGIYTTNAIVDSSYNGFAVENCILRYNGAGGVQVNSIHTNTTVRCNDIYENGRHFGHWDGYHSDTFGIKMWGELSYISGALIEWNKIHDNGELVSVDNAGYGVGIWLDSCLGTSGSPNVVRYNRVYENASYGVWAEVSSYSRVHGNVCYGNSDCEYTADIGIKAWGNNHADYNLIYNNTVCGAGFWGFQVDTNIGGDSPYLGYNQLCNNVSWGAVAGQEIWVGVGGNNDGTYGTGNIYHNNCFGPEGADFTRWGSTNYSTLAAWEAASSGAAVDNIKDDPQFFDADADQYWLVLESPCIGAGVNLGADYRQGLNPASSWPDGVLLRNQLSQWDLGAYVNKADQPTGAYHNYFRRLHRR